jgi:hypothetical protein
MQIAVLDSALPERGWHRGGDNIFYYKSNVDHAYYQIASTSNVDRDVMAATKKGFYQLDF